MSQKPITYYVQTPAVDALCKKYGSHLQHMPHLEKLAIASAASQAVFNAESELYSGLFEGEVSISYLATWEGFEFDNHDQVVKLLTQLDKELDAPMTTNLVIGICSNLDFIQD
ncbi:MAG: hypothetical protein AAGH78_01285 [Cyanobacteria bacterium P01_H01_bin.58]